MATITEDYVSFEVAKLLKEKGFDEECIGAYSETNHTITKFEPNVKNSEVGPLMYSAPTLQMATKWLRKVHTIDIVITPSMFHKKYNVCIYKDENLCCVDFDGATLSPSYEYACEAAIKYYLEKLW